MKINKIEYVPEIHTDSEGYKVPGYIEFKADSGTAKINALWFEEKKEKTMKRVVLLNTSIITSEGYFAYRKSSLDEAKELLQGTEMLSAIGHQSTAAILTELLSIEVPVNRITFSQEENDICIVFKLRGRPREGKIFTIEEIETIGYDFFLLTKENN